MAPGDVLVVRFTTPAYNTVLMIAGAVVTTEGALLSHAAVMARELGIPAVIGAEGALEEIPDGRGRAVMLKGTDVAVMRHGERVFAVGGTCPHRGGPIADGTVVGAEGLALDEANLTGESELVVRGPGEPVWSGSFAVEGAALFEATAVGPDSRAAKLTETARTFRHSRSPLERANDKLLLWLVLLSVPLAIGLTISAFAHTRTSTQRVQDITAGVVNLVPEGG